MHAHESDTLSQSLLHTERSYGYGQNRTIRAVLSAGKKAQQYTLHGAGRLHAPLAMPPLTSCLIKVNMVNWS